jgi:hypothetical protein
MVARNVYLNFAYETPQRVTQGPLPCSKILRYGASGFTSYPKEGVLRISIAIKNGSPRPGFNPRPLGGVANTLTTTPPRRLKSYLLTIYIKLLTLNKMN